MDCSGEMALLEVVAHFVSRRVVASFKESRAAGINFVHWETFGSQVCFPQQFTTPAVVFYVVLKGLAVIRFKQPNINASKHKKFVFLIN
jgi:hypothetical protein